jgi:S-adenosylmethionine decarboxylase
MLLKAEDYDFYGRHLIASYYECDEKALNDLPNLAAAMLSATADTKATIVDSIKYEFPEGGFSMLILVSESHASIHTYPEYRSCFVDVFTCGHTCEVENFHQTLLKYLRPQKTRKKVLIRR